MKKNIFNLVLSAFVFISLFFIFTHVSALTASDIDALLKAGIISAPQASVLNKSISAPGVVQVTTVDYSNSNCVEINNDLELGKKDTTANANSVSILQGFLYKNGYLTSTPTGFFGNMTLSAVKAFQTANGINPTGYVGPMTRSKIKNLDCNTSIVVAPSVSTSPVSSTAPITSKIENQVPVIKFTAKPTQIVAGETTTLEWNVLYAVDQCKISFKDPSGSTYSSMVDISGDKSTGSINRTTTYTILCYNKYGVPATQSVTIEVVTAESIAANQQKYAQAPSINSVSPSSTNRGDVVDIKGSGFTSTNSVYFDGLKIDNNLVLSLSSTSISIKIPEYKQCASVYCTPPRVDTKVETGGRKIIQVSNVNGYSNDFFVTLPSNIITIFAATVVAPYAPPKLSISSIKPISGNRGDNVTISGSGFSTDSIVFFGGFKVADNLILSRSDTSILFTAPPYQMGCTLPEYEVCPRLPLPGTGLVIETGGNKNVSVMNISSKATSTSMIFTLPSKKITY
jgi:N-acetylmuramoyl-L-alanine amidase